MRFIMVTDTCLFSRPFDLFVAKIIDQYTLFIYKHLVCYQREVDKGKLTAVASWR